MRRGELAAPSPFFEQQIDALREAARLGPVVDLASGRGRHALASASAGLSTIAVDRHAGLLRELEERAREARLPLSTVRFDLEQGLEPPPSRRDVAESCSSSASCTGHSAHRSSA